MFYLKSSSNNVDLPSFGSALCILGFLMFSVGVVGLSMGVKMIGISPYLNSQTLDAQNPNEHDIWPSNDDDPIIGHGLGFISNCVLAGGIALIIGLYLMGE
jgi:hypothetical protein